MHDKTFSTAPSSQLLLVPPARYVVKIFLLFFSISVLKEALRAEGERLLSPDDW
jgi:hypothetical protein